MKTHTITIVGVGLIGGSVGLAVKRRRLADRVLGVDRSSENLRTAEALDAIDNGTTQLADAVSDSQLVVVATPMHCIADQIIAVSKHAAPDGIITDTGSCKAQLTATVEKQIRDDVRFVGAHPLAGSERSGVRHAKADLFNGRVVVLTRTENTNASALEQVQSFWQTLGATTHVMSPAKHDDIVAHTSHAPHVLAAVLAGVLPEQCAPFVATGYRSTTRIAAGEPSLWTAIFEQNQTALLAALEPIEARCAEFRRAIETGDWQTVADLLTQAKKVRDDLGN